MLWPNVMECRDRLATISRILTFSILYEDSLGEPDGLDIPLIFQNRSLGFKELRVMFQLAIYYSMLSKSHPKIIVAFQVRKHQVIRYEYIPLSPLSAHRLSKF